jgi:hypothetical protein
MCPAWEATAIRAPLPLPAQPSRPQCNDSRGRRDLRAQLDRLRPGAKLIPELEIANEGFLDCQRLARDERIPTVPEFAPSIVRPRRLTTSLAPALIVIAAPPVATIPAGAPSVVMLTLY